MKSITMKFIDYDKLHAAFKPSSYVSKDANTIANILIYDLCIQPGSNLARFLEVKTCFDNHMAMRVWVQMTPAVKSVQLNLRDFNYAA